VYYPALFPSRKPTQSVDSTGGSWRILFVLQLILLVSTYKAWTGIALHRSFPGL
jgi:hypothetical protein